MPYNSRKRSAKGKPRSRPLDRGANYNAFGRDPDGRVTFFSAFFYGPDYIPNCPPQQFAGPPEPPRYGPPAPYQMACLPPGWKPRPPPNFYGAVEALDPPYLDPPSGAFDPQIFAALKHIPRFRPDPNFEAEDVDGYSTEAASGMGQDDELDEDTPMEIDSGSDTDRGSTREAEVQVHEGVTPEGAHEGMEELVEGVATLTLA